MTESEFRVVADMVARECPGTEIMMNGPDPLPQHIHGRKKPGVVYDPLVDIRANEPPRLLARRIVDAIRGVDGKVVVEEGSGNVFADVGLDDPERLLEEAHAARRARKAAEIPVKRTAVEEERCEFCGYTELDKRTLMDHHICEEKQVKERQKASPKTLVAGDPAVVMLAVPRERVDEVKAFLAGQPRFVRIPDVDAETARQIVMELKKMDTKSLVILPKPKETYIPPDIGLMAAAIARIEQDFKAEAARRVEAFAELKELVQRKTGGRA